MERINYSASRVNEDCDGGGVGLLLLHQAKRFPAVKSAISQSRLYRGCNFALLPES
jgi:hypothetical protein